MRLGRVKRPRNYSASIDGCCKQAFTQNRVVGVIAESTGSSAPELEKRVGERFAVLPNCFRLAPQTPEIIGCFDLGFSTRAAGASSMFGEGASIRPRDSQLERVSGDGI